MRTRKREDAKRKEKFLQVQSSGKGLVFSRLRAFA